MLSPAEAVRKAIDSYVEAIRNKDVAGVMALSKEDAVRFLLPPPLQTKKPAKQEMEEWFATFDGPIGYEIKDLTVVAENEVAFCHCLTRLQGTRTDGVKTDLWFRQTMGLKKVDGKWVMVHVHESVPLLMDGSGKAALDLKP